MSAASFRMMRERQKREKAILEPLEEQSDFNTMTRAQMEEFAAENSIDLSSATNNQQRREILQAGGV